MAKRKKIGLALGSGGARGFCHVGVLQVLLENNIPIDYISGCSMGALIAACYCCGAKIEDMISASISIKQRTIMDIGVDTKGINNNSGFIRGRRAMYIASKYIGDTTFENLDIPLRITAANLNSGKLITYHSGLILPAVRASISMPAIFKAPYDTEQNIVVDGGIIERVPINAVKELGADIVIAVDALGPPREAFEAKGIRTMANIIERSYLLIDWESTRHKLKEADIVITPDQGDRSLYIFKDNDYSIEQGRLAALEALPKILDII